MADNVNFQQVQMYEMPVLRYAPPEEFGDPADEGGELLWDDPAVLRYALPEDVEPEPAPGQEDVVLRYALPEDIQPTDEPGAGEEVDEEDPYQEVKEPSVAGKKVSDMTAEEKTKRLEDLKGELAYQESQKDIKQRALDKINQKLEADKEKFDEINEAIEKAIENAQDEQKKEQKKAIHNAMANYDQTKDGDWNTYLQNSLANVLDNDAIAKLTGGLSDEAAKIMSEFGDLQTKAGRLADDIGKIDKAIATIKAEQVEIDPTLAPDPTQGNLEQSLETIKGMLSCEEWALVEENNIDLAEKMENGEPRYIIANGKSDGKPHIYDMQNGGATLARQYACGQGFDIIECGNGYMYDYQDASDDCPNAETITYIGDCGGLMTKQANYQTCSPLSFDLNGDGVKTSDKQIQYDIDGDGKVDTINDSADAVLVFDKDGDGIAGEDGSECFGNNTDLDGDGKADGYKDGFEALKALAMKEGLINGLDDNKLDENDLKLLSEKYGLSIKTGGYNSEAKGLDEVGITEINLATTSETNLENNFDGNGNQLMTQQGATFTVNGETREYADIWHKKQNEAPTYTTTALNAAQAEEAEQSALSFDLSQVGRAKVFDANLEMVDTDVEIQGVKTQSIKNPEHIKKEEQIEE